MSMNAYGKIYRDIGIRLSKCRKAKRISQEKLAKLVGLTRTSIIHIEKGRQKAPLDKLYHIAEILEEDIFDILPRMERFTKRPNDHLVSQVDLVSRKRIKDDELGQILNAIKQEENNHDTT